MKLIKTDFNYEIGEVVTDIIYDIKSNLLSCNIMIGNIDQKIKLKEAIDNAISNDELDFSYDNLYKTNNVNAYEFDNLKEFNESSNIDICIVEIKSDGSLDLCIPNSSFDTEYENNHIGILKMMKAKCLIAVASGIKLSKTIKNLLESKKDEGFPASVILDHENSYLIVDSFSGKYIKED